MPGNATLVNFAGGETSPRSRGRFDQPWYQISARKMLNWIAELQGPARYRSGFVYAYQTRLGQTARAIPFVVNDETAYLLEFTPGYLRIRNPVTLALLTTTQATITGITTASTAVVTVSDATGLANGQEVVIASLVGGMQEINNRQFLIANLSGTTFNLTDPVTGATLDSSGLSAYSSGGTASVVQEVTTPYSAVDLQSLQVASADGTMYAVCPRQIPQKITVDAYNTFSITGYSRTNDPFAGSNLAVNVSDIRPVYIGDQRIGAAATLTPGAVAGAGISFTASAAAFTSADVGKYLRKIPSGVDTGQGYAKITAFVSTTQVTATITTTFDATTAIASGEWEVVTVETQVTLASNSTVNASLLYSFASVTGTTDVNGNNYYLVSIDKYGTSSNQKFFLRDSSNNSIDGSGFGTYISGGVATPVGTSTSINITNIQRGTQTRVTFASGSAIAPNVAYTFANVGGTTQINGGIYFLKRKSGNTYYLNTSSGDDVDSSTWSAYTSGGVATTSAENPLAVAFYEGRLVFAGTNQRPDCLFLSRSPDSKGNSRYDDFTGGTDADYACFFQLAPSGGSSSFISWARGGPDYLFIGTFGGPYRVSGSGLDIPITPTSINVRQFDTAGAEETMPAGLSQMFFVQRSGLTLRSIKVINPYLATFESADLCLNAEQIGYSPIQRVALQRGRPDCLWVVREDGILAGMSVRITVQNAETLTGWHRHQLGGPDAAVFDLAVMPRQAGYDQLWVVVQRTINGYSRCYFEVMADDVIFPDPEDFFGKSGSIPDLDTMPARVDSNASDGSRDADLALWQNAVWRLQEDYVHLDAEVSYDGSLRGTAAGATLTPSAVGVAQVEGQAAATITLTASAGVFTAADVGSEIWKKPRSDTGQGAGRATITAYIDAQNVTAKVTVPFDTVNAIAAGGWYFAVSTFYGFGHLEGDRVAAVADGAVIADAGLTGASDYPSLTVSNGKIVLPSGDLGQQIRAAVLRVGYPYVGVLQSHNLEMGGRSGPAQAKPRNISDLYIRFLNSLGCEYGADLYELSAIDHRLSSAVADRPAVPYSGIKRLNMEDSWSGLDDSTREKTVVVVQRLPLPAVVEFIDVHYDTTDEGGAG